MLLLIILIIVLAAVGGVLGTLLEVAAWATLIMILVGAALGFGIARAIGSRRGG